ncbi:hypothetical protein [Coxiella-like endosymbiont]|uniref:hypothetical protein n=1 Tax=Coxiella-like endosymbiont TaxID=1592897 RepID=UPI0027295330|nr:hypothetical protein [Coxiella-like endosymbiont]
MGKIKIQSQVGVGSTFACHIPIRISQSSINFEDLDEIDIAKEIIQESQLFSVRILVIEDDPYQHNM